MNLGISGKVAAVAAASQGLGFAAAHALAEEGAKVGICSRDKARIDAAAEKIRTATGADVASFAADLADADAAAEFVKSVAERFGRLDILVTNAGGPPPGGVDELARESVERGFRLTLLSAITMIKTAIPYMKKSEWGRIVNITSVTVKQPETTLLMSNTMRSALIGFSKSISMELARDNILINNVAPGYTRTERLTQLAGDLAKRKSTAPADVFKEWESHIPMGRLGDPSELAAAIAFLASERASYITGVTVQVDGGFIKGIM
ncbi:MAG: SDR family oxidoreductase [Chitinivibrionia bacterium]|nr:SDR family oxidoreductase [Chitinivibrionia bacterium]